MNELYKELKLCEEGDKVIIVDNKGIQEILRKIKKIDSHYIYTSDYKFSSSTGRGVTSASSDLIISSVIKNLYTSLIKEIRKDFKVFNVRISYIELISKDNVIFIYLSRKSENFNNACSLVIKIKSVLVFSGDIFSIEDYKTIKRTVIDRVL